jgi:hypothetical protein
MTPSKGQALVGAHIPAVVPLREIAKLPPNATTLRAVRRASITGTFVTAKSGDKAEVAGVAGAELHHLLVDYDPAVGGCGGRRTQLQRRRPPPPQRPPNDTIGQLSPGAADRKSHGQRGFAMTRDW